MHHGLAAGLLAASVLTTAGPAFAWSAASDWYQGNNTRARLVAASMTDAAGKQKVMAGLQIQLDEGWKTYWRTPGDAGGIPPTFDWDNSVNLKSAVLGYPAPHRFKDAAGTSVGYKDEVVYLINVTPKDASKPIDLKLGAVYGICKDICIPAASEFDLKLEEQPGIKEDIASLLGRYADLVPVAAAGVGSTLPSIAGINANLQARPPELLIEISFPSGTAGADLFVEAEDGSYVPVAEKLDEGADGRVRFRIGFSQVEDFRALAGKVVRLTLVSDGGRSEVVQKLP